MNERVNGRNLPLGLKREPSAYMLWQLRYDDTYVCGLKSNKLQLRGSNIRGNIRLVENNYYFTLTILCNVIKHHMPYFDSHTTVVPGHANAAACDGALCYGLWASGKVQIKRQPYAQLV